MRTPSNDRVYAALGIGIAAAGFALLVAIVASANPIGLSVGALIGAGFVFGVLGCGLKEAAARRGHKRSAALRAALVTSGVPASAAIVAMPRVADATASEFDEGEHPSFVPVTSLTEARVERQRVEQRRAALTRA